MRYTEAGYLPIDNNAADQANAPPNRSSGRYSFDYSNPEDLLKSAITKIASFFPGDRFVMEPVRSRMIQPMETPEVLDELTVDAYWGSNS